MKENKVLCILTAILMLSAIWVLSSCSKEKTEIYIIEEVKVQLTAQPKLTVKESGFRSSEYEHQYPESYTAYFVSAETKGQYTLGQLIKTITVNEGTQTVTVPKLKYDVYVTNYQKEGNWFTWNDAVAQLPLSSEALYLFGKNTIDYSATDNGTVEVLNPYAAVMVLDNQYVTGAPRFYGDGKDYVKAGDWWLRYIRLDNTNTKVPTTAGDYTLSRAIQPNRVYQYTIDGTVKDKDGNFTVTVQEFGETTQETIEIL